MKIIKSLAIAAGIAALAACAGAGEQDNAANMDANLTDMNAGMDMNVDMNAGADMNATANTGADTNAVANDTANTTANTAGNAY
jgi:hypothetical protein